MDMPGRSVTPSDPYRYGMNGQNKDSEVFVGFGAGGFAKVGVHYSFSKAYPLDKLSVPFKNKLFYNFMNNSNNKNDKPKR